MSPFDRYMLEIDAGIRMARANLKIRNFAQAREWLWYAKGQLVGVICTVRFEAAKKGGAS